MATYTNQLIHETSPYLLQHAHNPVQWYPWGEEALQKAKAEDKPILVSIGYAACHWCHVMERESFEDEAVAAMMNEHFVNIKIDREERPDLDHIYMDAVQAMTGQGGWPLNVFLTPDKKPFYGGTYFPPKSLYGRQSWKEVLAGINHAYKERRQEIEEQGNYLTAHLDKANHFGATAMNIRDFGITAVDLAAMAQQILQQSDTQFGGFGAAPKFPQTFVIRFLLRMAYLCKHNQDIQEIDKQLGEQCLEQASLSLDKMIRGGIYDQLGGGFARYATDREWLVPHFEKMLYDNALLVSVMCEAYQLTGQEHYKRAIEETIAFVQRDLMHEKGGFYAALDADSEGVEGKYYVWTKAEIVALLGQDAGLFCDYYDVTEEGNWEEVTILQVKAPLAQIAIAHGKTEAEARNIINNSKQLLLQHRYTRIPPALDDKVILSWNAMMNTACSKAFMATGNEAYKALAIKNMQFLLAAFQDKGGLLHHTWKNEQARYPAFLDDYACLVEALIHLYEITTDFDWLLKAQALVGTVEEHFSDEQDLFFYYTGKQQEDLLLRKKEVYDGAVPSGNSVMAHNLYKLSIVFSKAKWAERSFGMLQQLDKSIQQYPSSFGIWANILVELYAGTQEIVMVEPDMNEYFKILYEYLPFKIMLTVTPATAQLEWAKGKKKSGNANIFLCHQFSCKAPVDSVKELIMLINSDL
jgi:uncharacterized protein YyaL (SSP411 family)